MTKSREYKIWASMLTRCHNPNSISFKYYGARGVTVCDQWRNSFESFYAEVGPSPGKEFSLDRIDTLLGYCPGNVRWANRHVQNRNRRSTHLVTFNGETLCVQDWAEKLGIPRLTISDRLRRGWSPDRALTEPQGLHPEYRRIDFRGRSMTLREWSVETGINFDTLSSRLHEGWPIERALTESTNKEKRRG